MNKQNRFTDPRPIVKPLGYPDVYDGSQPFQVDISTKVDGARIIQTRSIRDRTMATTGEIVHRVLEIEDEQIRLALISMGWTPPMESEEDHG